MLARGLFCSPSSAWTPHRPLGKVPKSQRAEVEAPSPSGAEKLPQRLAGPFLPAMGLFVVVHASVFRISTWDEC